MTGSSAEILGSPVDFGVLEVDAGLRDMATQAVKLGPGSFLQALQKRARLRYWKVVCASPGRGILYVIVAGHVLGDDSNGQAAVLGQHEGRRQADYAGSAKSEEGSVSAWTIAGYCM